MSDYNTAFVDALRLAMDGGSRDALMRKRSAELVKNREVERLFPGRDALWLQKELSKWRGKIKGDTFNGTLKSLELYCTLMGVTPNDVLLPRGEYTGQARMEFLGQETIVDMGRTIREESICLPHGIALPVLYAPERMTAIFLFLLPQRRAGRDTAIMRFAVSEPDGYAEEDGAGGITTSLDSSLYMADLSMDDWESRLRSAYRKVFGEFEAAFGGVELPMEDVIHEFYDLMGDWSREGGEDLLFTRYPPRKKKIARRASLDFLSGEAGGIGIAGRER